MSELLKNLFKHQGAKIALCLVITLIAIDTFLTYRYKVEMNRNLAEQTRLNEISAQKGLIISNLNNIDMSIRGFLLVGNEAFVGTYEKIKSQNNPTLQYLETNLPAIGISSSSLSDMRRMLENYFVLMDKVIQLSRAGEREQALAIINEDHGTAVWQTYMNLSGVIDPVIQEMKMESDERYNRLLSISLAFQFILFAIGVPTLIITIVNLTRTYRRRKGLFMQLDQQNRKLIFDSNVAVDIENEDQVINDMITNLNKAATFIKGISQGDYDVKWEGFNKANAETNQHNISGELLVMREAMKKKQQEAVRQQWVSEGLNKIAEIIRDHQTNFELLCHHSLSFIVKYLGAQQGGIFVINEHDQDDRFIELVSCFAFNKKKFVTKRIEIGEGIIGQTFLEGEPVYLREVPNEYVKITSGLGEANPKFLTIYPMKQNETVVALIEVATFSTLDQYALGFLESACKSIAASIVALQSSEKTKLLLERAQQQAEELRAQEEEMRQNMEELEATQEEMRRREIGMRSAVDHAN